jgi:hypothetical protein
MRATPETSSPPFAPGAPPPYRRAAGVTLIEIRLTRIEQLFNSLDHAPFLEKDLDEDAEEYIVGALRDLGRREPARLVLHLPAAELQRIDPDAIGASIRHYFAYRLWGERRRLRRELRVGVASLAIGLSFLAACIALRNVVAATWHTGWADAVQEGLLISGWVAMWRPIEIFLYDWWPIWQTGRLHARLAELPVECRAL